ncbi:MAG: hypothetical protein AB8C02_12900 [Halioglobus sp.]
MIPSKYPVFVMASVTLIACGGTQSTVSNAIYELTQLDMINQEFASLSTSIVQSEYTEILSIPEIGTVFYSGFVRANIASNDQHMPDTIIGRLETQFNLAEGSFSANGQVHQVYDDTGRGLQGTLEVANGSLNRQGDPQVASTLAFRATGTLFSAEEESLDFNIRMDGDFLGEEASMIAGIVTGQVENAGQTHVVSGVFAGQ